MLPTSSPRAARASNPEKFITASFAAMLEGLDLTAIRFPVLAINGEYDRPRAKTHRRWRELASFTNVVLPGKGHLSASMAGWIPQQYVDSRVHFIRSHEPGGARVA